MRRYKGSKRDSTTNQLLLSKVRVNWLLIIDIPLLQNILMIININTQLGMTLYDPELAEIIKNREVVEIKGNRYHIESSPLGTCDGCCFMGKKCPQRAVTYCTSNGGNIIVEANDRQRKS